MATKERAPADRSLSNLQSAADLPWTGAGADRNSQNPWLGAADLRSRRLGNQEHQSTSTNQGLGPEPDRQVRGCYKKPIAKTRPLRVDRASVTTRAVSDVSVIPMLPSRFPSSGASRVCRYRDKATIVRAQTDRGVVSRARAGLIWLTDRGSLRVYLRLECATQSGARLFFRQERL